MKAEMNEKQMKPCLVKVGVIEPWEFPWESLAAEVQDGTDDCLLIKLREKIRYKNTDVVQLIAEPRSREGSFDKIEGGQKIVTCMTADPHPTQFGCSIEL